MVESKEPVEDDERYEESKDEGSDEYEESEAERSKESKDEGSEDSEDERPCSIKTLRVKSKYQIFLSFRGEDTRYSFTTILYHVLHEKGFKIFMDDRGLHRWDPIPEVIMEAIENSKFSIIIFSEKFAHSTKCLDEVVKILHCKEKKNQLVLPVFYKLDPSAVRHQKYGYGSAMFQHERRFGSDSKIVRNWRSALTRVCSFRGLHYQGHGEYERDFIDHILTDVMNNKDRL